MLELLNVSKDYPTPRGVLPILQNISLSLSSSAGVSITGPSGSGKSTLLYIMGALEPPTSGAVRLGGENPFELDEKRLATFRNRKIGFVFQDHCLLPQCSVIENVLAPTLVAESNDDFSKRAKQLLNEVGLTSRLDHRPAELSGGEKQRVALARALIMSPTLILCDEPTGNLDRDSAETVASLLLDLHRKQETILVVVTHNPELASKFPQTFRLVGGQLHGS